MFIFPPNTKLKTKTNLGGFTLIELIVVIAVIVLLTTAVLVNFASQKGPRNLRIATGELSTNIRKIQSFTLSSRDTANGTPVLFYMMTFSTLTGANSSYTTYIIDKNSLVTTNEVVNLPQDVSISAISVLGADGVTVNNIKCMQIAFKLPFAITYIEYDNNAGPGCAVDLASHQSNPVLLASMINRKATITLREKISGKTTTVVVNGVSGVISQP